MRIRGRVRASAGALALGVVVALMLVGGMVSARQKQQAAKLDKDQLQDAQALTSALAAAESGQSAPSEFATAVESYHFFKTANGQTYVPFTATVDQKALASPSVAFMLRVVARDAKPQPPAENGKKAALLPAAYEDLQFFTITPEPASTGSAGQPAAAEASITRFRRAFQVSGGDYDVYLALLDHNPADKKKPKIAVFKQAMSVPDFNGTELQTSSVVVSDRIEATTKVLTPQERRENPYVIGPIEINPKVGSQFASAQELNVYFQIYNPALDAAKKPDVLVEFGFVQKQPDGTEKKVANSEPQVLSATTLAPEFDITKHQLVGGSAWPLTRFKAGKYRVDIKITDKLSGKILTRTADFSVS